jgi:hypothetical protein
VSACPSGALSYRLNDSGTAAVQTSTEVEVTANGPLLVKGGCLVKHPDGRTEVRETVSAFCRCGASANKPYCDGSHRKSGFVG